MAEEEIIYTFGVRCPQLLVNISYISTAAEHLADHGPMWETSIRVTFRFQHRPVSLDNPVY